MRTRRHHNNKGLRQIKNGKTRRQIDNIRKQLIKEGKMITINFRPEMIKFGTHLTGHDEDTIAQMLKDYERGTIKSIPVERVVKPTLAERLNAIRDEIESILYRTFPDRDREDGECWDNVYNEKEETCKHATTKIFDEIVSKCSL